jgi:hypothetical protein
MATDKVSLGSGYPTVPKSHRLTPLPQRLLLARGFISTFQSTPQNRITLHVNSVRGGINCYSGETNALRRAEFSRQRASSRSRIAMWGFYFEPSRSYGLRPGPLSNQSKALGISVTTPEGEQ